ncbi:ubiquitin-conjugating enzyme/RWD-like protein [Phyllosticta citrichinensis]|uniref:Ubiquitin-conjugating enzyme/RWD-like protein n=1 Tax=Phyllosticta citrichinensis TaxID=1130410 RepID=A0ABR1XQI7_9PEZI
MTTRGQFNTKNPTIKRILKEASELASQPSPEFHAEPLEDNLFEWHFTLRGPPEPSPYAVGLYHGRIILPAQYPLRPPSFRFVTPSGRFEVNREICLSISGHHEESWQPAWGIRTALVAIRSFMDTDAKGQVGGIDSTEAARKKLASESVAWRCGACGKTNDEIMKGREIVEEADGNRKRDEVPEELRLAYKDEMGEKEKQKGEASASTSQNASHAEREQQRASQPQPSDSTLRSRNMPTSNFAAPASAQPAQPAAQAAPRTALAPTRTIPAAPPLQQQQQQQPRDDGIPAWIDKAIYGVVTALAFLILRKFIY